MCVSEWLVCTADLSMEWCFGFDAYSMNRKYSCDYSNDRALPLLPRPLSVSGILSKTMTFPLQTTAISSLSTFYPFGLVGYKLKWKYLWYIVLFIDSMDFIWLFNSSDSRSFWLFMVTQPCFQTDFRSNQSKTALIKHEFTISAK